MTASAFIVLSLMGWLNPFADKGDRLSDVETIESLQDREVVIPEAPPIQADGRAALEQYRRYLELPDGDPATRLEAMRRLGDLNLEVGENANIDDSAYSAEMQFHHDAIRLYEQLLSQYSGYGKADRVMYQLSRAYESSGQPEQVLQVLDRLVSEYPDSPFIDEAQFRRGEMLFARKQYYEAGEAFAVVTSFGNVSGFYEQALYKFGWTQFKQAEYDTGIHAFMDLLNLRLAAAAARQGASSNEFNITESMSRPERELMDDTLRVLSLSFSYLDGPDSITAYLDERNRGDSAWLLFSSLGSLYLDKERYLDAAETYEGFVQRDPFHAQAPAVSTQAIEAYRAGRFPTLVLEAKENFVNAYGLDSDFWAFHNPAERTDVIGPLKQNLSDLAQHDHAEAQKTAAPEAYARAADWYKRYLDYFPDDPDSAQRSFLLGEIYMESKQYADANHYYLRAAYNYPGYAQAGEAGYAALLASRAHLQQLPADEQSAWRLQQQAQALRFATVFPAHEQAGPVLSKAAETYFEAGELDEAVVVSGELIGREELTNPELKRVAWTVAAHGLFDLGHFRRAERAYLELRFMGGNKELAGVKLDDRIAAAVYRQAEMAQAEGRAADAVGHFMRIESAAPLSAIKGDAVYDAATLLINEQQWDQAIEVLNHYRSAYRNPQRSDAVTQKLAVAYQQAGRASESATEYEKIAVMASVGADIQREALWNSAELYENAGDKSAARRVWKSFVAKFPDPLAESIEVRLRLANLAGDAGDARDRRDWLQNIIDTDAKAGAQRSERSKTLAARATLELAEPVRLAFVAVNLKAPLTDSLKLKKKRMEEALAAYDGAAAYGVAEVTTQATYRIAELYQQLGQSLMSSERPAELSEEELEQYEILLEEQAFPFEEQAIELFTVNAARSAEGVYDEWVAQSFARLAELMPARYAKYEKAEEHVAKLL